MELSTQKGGGNHHTPQILERPSLNGLLCAVRMMERQTLYEESKEVVFWGDAVLSDEVQRVFQENR